MLRAVFDFLSLVLGLIIYVLTKKTPQKSYMAMINLFCQTKGYSNDILHYFVYKIKNVYSLPDQIKGLLGIYSINDIKQITYTIEKDGYYIFPTKLQNDTIARLYSFATNANTFLRPMESDTRPLQEREQGKIDQDNPKAVTYDIDKKDILMNSDIQDILGDTTFWAIAQEYLKCSPVIDNLSMRWHTAYSTEANAEAATMYHFDMERIKWLKVFIYLTDVSIKNGPHVFIKGTHKSGKVPAKLLKKRYARLTDDEVFQVYSKDDEIIYTAPKGTVILEDTRGIHKASPVQEGNRLVLELQFSDCLFGANLDSVILPNKISHELSEAIKEYPDVYSNYKMDTN